MSILVINCGSSTIKYQLYGDSVERVLAKGIAARLGEDGSYVSQQTEKGKFKETLPIPTHREAFGLIVGLLLDPVHGVLHDIHEVTSVGHRAVHGADVFLESTLITSQVIDKLEECVPLAPLHNPPNLLGIREAMRIFPDVPHVAVFDTSFNQSMQPKAYLYALPMEYYKQHKIRKYGFHGTSCRYVSQQAAEALHKRPEDLKMVICHLGNGVTITAVAGGKVVDTSIGFATFGGVMMGTRTGDIDPGLIFFLNRQLGMSLERVESLYYRESGLLGVSGISNDMRVLTELAAEGDQSCQLAMDMFAYRVKQYIGSYTASMGGLDALVFTAGIGENATRIREMICEDMEFFGIKLDRARNDQTLSVEATISTADSPTAVLVVPTDEEKMIALDTAHIAAQVSAAFQGLWLREKPALAPLGKRTKASRRRRYPRAITCAQGRLPDIARWPGDRRFSAACDPRRDRPRAGAARSSYSGRISTW
jgi:acetate kinase